MAVSLLIIEDEPAIADALQFVLRGEGFTVQHANTLGQARSFLGKTSYALIILDIGLPDGNGIEFCKALRQTSTIPVLFLTARQEELDRIIALEIGGDDYVTKPFSPREVAARVKAILRRSAQPPQATPAIADNIAIHLDKAKATLCGQDLELTRNELFLLHCLHNSPGQVFSRRQLMEAVWEVPEASMERTVDAHIKSLRKKITALSQQHPEQFSADFDPIETHRGFGYSWRAQ